MRVNLGFGVPADPAQLSVHELGPEESDSLTDPALLAEILEAREELEEATSAEEVDAIRKINHGESPAIPPQLPGDLELGIYSTQADPRLKRRSSKPLLRSETRLTRNRRILLEQRSSPCS
jgi:hypothetical protein